MAIANVKSGEMYTFPSSMREKFDVYSRFTTERNLVNMVNSLVDVEGYVHTVGTGNNPSIDFILGGYYFSTDIKSIMDAFQSTPTEVVYAYAIVGYSASASIGGNIRDSRLVGWINGALSSAVDTGSDNTSDFIGVGFADSEADIPVEGTDVDDSFRVYSLKLLVKSNNTWVVPDESLRKFEVLSYVPDDTCDVDLIFNDADAENIQ